DAVERLTRAGLPQYEISNFGDPCRHNLRYWRREEYLGLGVGAHSFVGGRRFANTRDVERYMTWDGFSNPSFVETLSEEDIRRETIFLRLRQSSGIDYDDVVRLC